MDKKPHYSLTKLSDDFKLSDKYPYIIYSTEDSNLTNTKTIKDILKSLGIPVRKDEYSFSSSTGLLLTKEEFDLITLVVDNIELSSGSLRNVSVLLHVYTFDKELE